MQESVTDTLSTIHDMATGSLTTNCKAHHQQMSFPHYICRNAEYSDHAKQGLEAFITPVNSEEIANLRIELENISRLSEKYLSRRQVILRELKEIAAEVLEKGRFMDRRVIIVDVRESLVKADEVMGLVEAASTEHLQLLSEKLKVSPQI